ncbi:hypothetical protein PoB_001640500 [Plakobranchus ocellatus]|uniref:Uncharacterized protein n=1 Tax=Plakobranchus ocellatus TaxID=259542 RepID=A0AAV3Z3A6_9GAST|nr:hypothetical protein PoB_001640500 [Plakobranchus ocellatus]
MFYVFHSHNEYKAHRRNRTEQLYLRDLSAGLGREEKLYAKEYAFQRSSFHRHYARRFSTPLLPAPLAAPSRAATAPPPALVTSPNTGPGSGSQINGNSRTIISATYSNGSHSSNTRPESQPCPKASVFSASAGLRNATASSSSSTPLAARMLDGLKEVSVSTRFQRVQRKFSIASMTEHGCLTDKGNSLANDIQKARKHLFGKSSPGLGRSQHVKDVLAKIDAERSKRDSMSKVDEEQKEGEPVKEIEETEKHKNTKDDNSMKDLSPEDVAVDPKGDINTKCEDTDANGSMNKGSKASKPTNRENIIEKSETIQNIVSDPKLRMPFLKLRASLNFTKQKNSNEHCHVTIADPGPEEKNVILDDVAEEETEDDEALLQEDLIARQTSSIFNRVLSNTPYVEPLQMKIKEFLNEQSTFNRRFPKGQVTPVVQSDRHLELVNRERKKKEKEKEKEKKKKDMVFEVLTKLGITDEHIWFHYKQ